MNYDPISITLPNGAPWLVRGTDLEELGLAGGRLKVCVSREPNRCIIQFNEPLCFRWLDEGDAISILSALGQNWHGQFIALKILGGDLGLWFETESARIKTADKFYQYMILTENDVIEVISFDQPAVIVE